MRLLLSLAAAVGIVSVSGVAAEPRCFPDDFMFGSATAAYQVEGAVREGGREPCVWDEWCRIKPNVQCANVADDFYHRYKDDIKLMVETGLHSFRFSVAWSRVMNWDKTTKRMKPNPEGIKFYHSLIDELRANNIVPILTLYHYDLPLVLEKELTPGGWLNEEIQDHFLDFSDLVFREYGAKVDLWTTFNEPLGVIGYAYGMGLVMPPALSGSDTQAYVASKNLLVSHAKSVARFRELKKEGVVGAKARISIVLVSSYYYPLDPSNPKDIEAAERGMQFDMGWFLEPIVSGDYPAVMRERAGDRLPKFSEEESKLLKGSYDLFMLNHYFSNAVTDCDSPTSVTKCEDLPPGWPRDKAIDAAHVIPGSMQGKVDKRGNDHCTMFTGYPPGYVEYMKWVHAKDPSADILLTENGWCGDDQIDNLEQLKFFKLFLEQVYIAVHDEKLPVIGYTAWSFLDNYEWGTYDSRFGLYYVNYSEQTGSPDFYEPKPTDLTRIPRTSAKWFKKVATTRCLDGWSELEVEQLALARVDEASTSFFGFGILVAAVIGVAVALIAARKRRRGYEAIPLL